MEITKNDLFVQIGVFDGNDEFCHLVKYYDVKRTILVEPNKDMNKQIMKHYRFVPNVFIENVAITEVNKGMIDLVHPDRQKGVPFYNPCFSAFPMDDWGG